MKYKKLKQPVLKRMLDNHFKDNYVYLPYSQGSVYLKDLYNNKLYELERIWGKKYIVVKVPKELYNEIK